MMGLRYQGGRQRGKEVRKEGYCRVIHIDARTVRGSHNTNARNLRMLLS